MMFVDTPIVVHTASPSVDSISTRTAETHRSTLMRKLNLRNTADVVRFAIRNQIIEP